MIFIKKIIFVCTGNTCRSPMAEALFNYYNKDEEFKAESAGITAVEGAEVSDYSVKAVKELIGEDISFHKARCLTENDLSDSYMVLTMTEGQKSIIKALSPVNTDNVSTIGEEDVDDPYMSDYDRYLKCAKQIEKYVIEIIERLGDKK